MSAITSPCDRDHKDRPATQKGLLGLHTKLGGTQLDRTRNQKL